MSAAGSTKGPSEGAWCVSGQWGVTMPKARAGRFIVATKAEPHIELASFKRIEDAKLAASAPEMVEALRNLLYVSVAEDGAFVAPDEGSVERARAALRKAGAP